MFCFIHETVLRIGGKILSGKIDLLEFVANLLVKNHSSATRDFFNIVTR
jgi:hypothetical protein